MFYKGSKVPLADTRHIRSQVDEGKNAPVTEAVEGRT
jgi:hypothetical protein